MHSSAVRLPIFLLSLLATYVGAVSLADFTPRVEDLTGKCATVYHEDINDCTSQDLATGDNCSIQCISGLIALAQEVKAACSDADVAETSLIGVFLLGKGPATLCSNIAATVTTSATSSGSSSSQISEQSSTLELSSPASTPTGIVVDTSTSSPASSTESTAAATSTASTSSTAAATSAAATTTFAAATSSTAGSGSITSETSAPTSSSSSSSSSSNDDAGSGGGSPFDFVSGTAVVGVSTWLLGMALAMCGFLAQAGL